jgi:GAF domain-containing protein
MELLYTIANQVGVAIRNTQTIEHLRQKSVELRRASKLVSKALGASLDSPGAGQTIVDLAAEIIGAERCLLYSIDRGSMNLLAAHGLRIVSPTVSHGELETTAAWIARRGKSIVRSKETPERQIIVPTEFFSLLGRSGTYIGIPLKVGNDVVGVLEAYTREARTITSDELRHFRAFGGQATVALQNAMLVERATKLQTNLKTVAVIASELSNGRSSTEIITKSLSHLGRALSAHSVVVSGTAMDYVWNCDEVEFADDMPAPRLTVDIAGDDKQVAGQLAINRKPGGDSFGESDRQLTRTVADILATMLLSKL